MCYTEAEGLQVICWQVSETKKRNKESDFGKESVWGWQHGWKIDRWSLISKGAHKCTHSTPFMYWRGWNWSFVHITKYVLSYWNTSSTPGASTLKSTKFYKTAKTSKERKDRPTLPRVKIKSINDNYRLVTQNLWAKQPQFETRAPKAKSEAVTKESRFSYLIQHTWPQVWVNSQLHSPPLLSLLLSSFIDLPVRLHFYDIFGCRGFISQTTASIWGDIQPHAPISVIIFYSCCMPT